MAAKKKTTKKTATKTKEQPKKEAPKAEPKQAKRYTVKLKVAEPLKKDAKPKVKSTPESLRVGRTPDQGNWWVCECTATGEQGPTRADIGPALSAFLDGERAEKPVELHRPIPLLNAGSGFVQMAEDRL